LARFVPAALAAVTPFAVIAGVFAAVLAWHLGTPARATARFEATLSGQAPPEHAVADDDGVALTRLSCFGACPAYRVRIDGSGRVDFMGQAGVCETRPGPVHVDRESAQRLIAALDAAGFAALPRVFGRRSETPGQVVELRIGGVARRVVDNGVPPADAPLVKAAAAAIDRLADTARWLPRPRADGPPWCPLPDGRRGVFPPGGGRLVPEAPAASAP
jgi:hypothetical protein